MKGRSDPAPDRKPMGIRTMLTVSVIGMGMLLGAMIIGTLALTVRPALLSGLARHGDAMAADLSGEAEPSLAVGDTLHLKQRATAMAADDEVREIVVRGPDGRPLVYVRGEGFDRWKTPWNREGGLIHCVKPVRARSSRLDGDVFGLEASLHQPTATAAPIAEVEVVMNSGRIQRSIERVMGIVAFLIALFIVFALRSVVPRLLVPVLELADAAECVGKGRQGVRVPETAPSELGRLQAAFNAMVVSLEEHAGSLREKNAELESALHDSETLYRELKQTQGAMLKSEKLRAIGEMASGIAHDLNNVLTAVIGRAQILQLRLRKGPQPPEEISANLSILIQAAEDGARTVQRLQQYYKGAPKTALQAVDLAVIVPQVVEMATPRFRSARTREGQQIEVELRLAPESVVAADESDLREALMNVIYNAIDAMPNGGRISFITRSDGGKVSLQIADTGTGMDEDTQKRAFDPFFTTKGTRGNGLGLSIVAGLVRGMEGKIQLSSKAGSGTCITMTLRRWTGEIPRTQLPAVVKPRGPLEPFSCLIVDDNGTALDNLRQMLEILGVRVTTTDTGRQACELLAGESYDLVISDLGMPEVTGWDVAAAAHRTHPGLRVVLCTGWGDELSQQEARERGVWRILSKPYTLGQLRDLVEATAEDRERRKPAA